MKPIVIAALATVLSGSLCGCGAKDPSSSTASPTPRAATAAAESKYDRGPRAAEEPIQEAQVATGKRLFQDKGCSACHAFGRKVTGPDLDGVTQRRTSAWMENQILHPEVMTKEDPIARALFAQFALQMPNQKLTADEARAVIEFLKHENHEALEARAAHESH